MGVEREKGDAPRIVLPDALKASALKSIGGYQIHSIELGTDAFRKVLEWITVQERGYIHPFHKAGNVFDTPGKPRISLVIADERSRLQPG